MSASDVRVQVDTFLADEKALSGDGDFNPTDHPDELEWRRPIVHLNVVSDAELRIIAYPASPRREFRVLIVMLNYCITRLDFVFDRDGPHINDFNKPMGYPSFPIRGPHVHLWPANRHLARVDRLPQKLLYAIEIDDKINSLDRAFKWFCDETKISFTSSAVPEWPSRRLI